MMERSYRCSVCGWQGQLEPLGAGDASPCPQCGVYLYPNSWGQTWGVASAGRRFGGRRCGCRDLSDEVSGHP